MFHSFNILYSSSTIPVSFISLPNQPSEVFLAYKAAPM